MYNSNIKTCQHRWIKKNLVTISRKGKMFDEVVCEYCNMKGRRYGFESVKNMSHLKTVPTFVFNQNAEDIFEQPIIVSYYNGSIELSQNDESIVIHPELIKGLFKEIIKHQPEAQAWLDRKFKN